ncbi:hypothetical protein TNCV_1816341 [Trichonephila clavipes]|nr:hypothetical protein TNCV_1816341 [Trichonephila clavipes]
MQVTVRFCSVPPQFKGRKPWGGQKPPTSLPLPPTTREDLRLDTGLACSHPRMPRAHQAGFSRRLLAGAGFFENVRSHGPGVALLTNGGVQQQQKLYTNYLN